MLVLTRKIGERLILTTEQGERIEILLIAARCDKAKVGVEAPQSVKVMREELIQTEGK